MHCHYSKLIRIARTVSFNLAYIIFSGNKTFATIIPDSSLQVYGRFNGSLAVAFAGQQNWNNQSYGSWSAANSINYNFYHRDQHKSKTLNFRSDLSFIRLNDSIWNKNNDLFEINLNTVAAEMKMKSSLSFFLRSQWLNSYTLTNDSKQWNGGFMNPFTSEFSWSLSKFILKNSRFEISPAAIKLNGLPRITGEVNKDLSDRSLIVTRHSYLRSEYGLSAALSINEEFYNKLLRLDHQSRLFFNALNRKSIHFSLRNQVVFCILRYLQVKFDTQVAYDPDRSLKFQYRQEVLIGIFYEKQHH